MNAAAATQLICHLRVPRSGDTRKTEYVCLTRGSQSRGGCLSLLPAREREVEGAEEVLTHEGRVRSTGGTYFS